MLIGRYCSKTNIRLERFDPHQLIKAWFNKLVRLWHKEILTLTAESGISSDIRQVDQTVASNRGSRDQDVELLMFNHVDEL